MTGGWSPGRAGSSGRDIVLGAVLFVVYLVGGLAARHQDVVPGEVFVVLLPLGAFLIWRYATGRPFAAMGVRRVDGWRRHILLPAVVATTYGALTLALAHAAGLRTATDAAPSLWTGAGIVLVLAPLVAVVFTALPEEFVFRGFFLHAFERRTGLMVAAIVSSALFALAHLPILLDGDVAGGALGVRMVWLFAFGLLMVWVVVRTGAVWFPVAWHAGGNYANVVAEFLLGSRVEAGVGAQLWMLAILAGEAALVAVLLTRWPPETDGVRLGGGRVVPPPRTR